MDNWQELESALKVVAALGLFAALTLVWMAYAEHPTAVGLRRALLTTAVDLT